jgi:hypothetical protein
MKRFLKRHSDRITGTLSGFDRVLFRGTLRSIAYVSGLEVFLYSQHVLFKKGHQVMATALKFRQPDIALLAA